MTEFGAPGENESLFVAGSDISFETLEKPMRKKKTVMMWGAAARAKVMAANKARAAKRKALEELGDIDSQLTNIRNKAEALTSPETYSVDKYLVDLYAHLARWKRAGKVSHYLKCVKLSAGIELKSGANPLLVLIKRTSDFDRKRAGKFARKLSEELAKGSSLAKFKAHL